MTFLTDRASFSVRQYKIEKKHPWKSLIIAISWKFQIIFMSNRSWGAMAVIYKGFSDWKHEWFVLLPQGIMIMVNDVSPESLRIWLVTSRTFLFSVFFFYWSIVTLQYCVNFSCNKSKSAICLHISLFLVSFPFMLTQRH